MFIMKIKYLHDRIELTNIAHEIQMKYADVYICLKYLVISNN